MFRKTPEKLLAKALKKYDKDKLVWVLNEWGKVDYEVIDPHRFLGINYTEEESFFYQSWRVKLFVLLSSEITWGGKMMNAKKLIGVIYNV